MKGKKVFVRFCYWLGAVVDLMVGVDMVFNFFTGAGNTDTKRLMIAGAGTMLGWTALLIWADRAPVERRGVLWLTLIPIGIILPGNIFNQIKYGYETWRAVLLIGGGVLLAGLYITAFTVARQLARRQPE